MPKISVILTSYNHAKHIREAIDSVLAQTIKDFELIVWDDCSNDHSWEIIKSYKDTRIKAFRNDENYHAAYGVNKAITEAASGKYIAIHHSDDVWETTKLERQVEFLDKNTGFGAVFTNALVIGEDGGLFKDASHFYYSIFDQPNRTRHEWLNFFFYHGNALCHPSVLIRKECYRDCGLYRSDLAQLADFDMWTRLCLKYEIHVLPDKLVRFRVRENETNSSGNRPKVRIRGPIELHDILNNYLSLKTFKDLRAVFPSVQKYDRPGACEPRFILAMAALEDNTMSCVKLFGFELLFDLLREPKGAGAIRSLYGFDDRDVIELTGKHDLFFLENMTMLNGALAERDTQNTSLNKAIADLDKKVDSLKRVVLKRDGQIVNLNQSIVERDGQIASLSQTVAERNSEIGAIRAELNGIYSSKKWKLVLKIAAPVLLAKAGMSKMKRWRRVAQQRNFNAKWYLNQNPDVAASDMDPYEHYVSYGKAEGRQPSPDSFFMPFLVRCMAKVKLLWAVLLLVKRHAGGIRKAANKAWGVFKEEGWIGVWNRAIFLKSQVTRGEGSLLAFGGNDYTEWIRRRYDRIRSSARQLSLKSVLVLDEIAGKTVELPKDVAVHAHIFYPALAAEIRSYLVNIPVKFHFYVTTDTLEKAKLIEDTFLNMKNILVLEIHITENRGRDIFPMLVTLGAKLAQHEIVLHIHTKRSPHNSWVLGGWGRYLMESLLGNPQRVTAIFQQFVQNKNLGILFPTPYHPVKLLLMIAPDANATNIKKLLRRAGKKKTRINNIDETFFPAGNMFWFRGKAIKPFVDMKLSNQDFEPEEGQANQTLAHAIERMFPYFASEMGMLTKSYSVNSFLSQECSAHKFYLLHTFLKKGLILNPTIIFDHNGGGGANTYTRELVENINSVGDSVLRVYCFDAVWFIQWFGDGDGMLFYTSSFEELFEFLSVSRSASIVINSLYGYPDIKMAASNIVGLAQTLNATLDFKIHDFYALCSSPHLLDFEGKYCGVPQDFGVCSRCLKRNYGWYHSWYPEENKPIDIAEWRKPFAELFEAATTVTFFDSSAVKIVRQAFYLESSKVKVIPHTINYFKCDNQMNIKGPLHIGILGTLSQGKGGNVVKALYEHIEKQGIHIPITVVGPSVVEVPLRINVHGNYSPNDLPTIVGNNGINVILVPSIVPETFSYTISEAMKMGLPIVAFNLGAQGNRVKKYTLGEVVPLGSSPEVILAAIRSVLKTAKEFKK